MPHYLFFVFSNPTEGQEAEFNRWYDEQHLADVINVPGFVWAERYRLADTQSALNPQAPSHRYLALYAIETDDIAGTMRELEARVGTPHLVMSDALDMSLNAPVYEQITHRLLAQDVQRQRHAVG